MIEQIKQDLVEWDELVVKRPDLKGRCGKWPEWVRSLIGEVERLEETNKQIIKTADVIDARNQELIGQVEELQKALKQWEDFANHLNNITLCGMTKNEIRQALNTFAERSETK
jgi:FtsZ-binding cell division protein ZapB